MNSIRQIVGLATLFVTTIFLVHADAPPLKNSDPLKPEDERKSFLLLPGYDAKLVAAEPDVVDPVAMCFDHHGRLFVCEMRGYPNGGVATGPESGGRIRCLVDEDHDGKFEKSWFFAEGLRFPNGIMPWRNGFIVCNAPDLLYLEDRDGDGKVDHRTVLYTGFALANIQQMVNTPRLALDGWVHCMVGGNGGEITSPQDPKMKPLPLRGRGIRFNPDQPGSIEPISGGGQYGLTFDEAGHSFTNTNSQHLRQIVLPDHYLKRNPYLSASTTTFDIPEHGAACKLFRISPFEAWRVERTTRRKDSKESSRFPSTELIPGGYTTSSCSPVWFNVDAYPDADRKMVYLCDPANNLIMRDRLEPNGSLFTAKRADTTQEFFSSKDNWCRPVYLDIGHDGVLYFCDFYREVIETPLSLPEDIKARVILNSRDRGRIWKITPSSFQPKQLLDYATVSLPTLVIELNDSNPWRRTTAFRLLIQNPPKGLESALREALPKATSFGIAPILATLKFINRLKPEDVQVALNYADPAVREMGLKFAEPLLNSSPLLQQQVLKMVDDSSSLVRLQVAFTLGEFSTSQAGAALGQLLSSADADVWLQTAVLSSAKTSGPALLESIATQPNPKVALVTRIAAMIGGESDAAKTAKVLQMLDKVAPTTQVALLDGLGQGLQNSATPLNQLWEKPAPELKSVIEQARKLFDQAATRSGNASEKMAVRIDAARILGYGPFSIARDSLPNLLAPQAASDLQSTAVRSLAQHADKTVAETLLSNWTGYSPNLRREVTEVLLARNDRTIKLLDAIEKGTVLPNQLGSDRIDALRNHKVKAIQERAKPLLAKITQSDRSKLVMAYQSALTASGDLEKGRAVFRKNCVSCHRLENQGHEVGANLLAAIKDKPRDYLLVAILDPSREVDSRYVNYTVTTTTGKSITGILAIETPTSLVLKRGDNAEDTILRTQIEEVRASTKSLMPEEFEKQISPAEMADLLKYLQEITR
jgi:putative membrane-bound dehydrogenase-like protein